ncbi:prominin-like protein isoform X2 [Manduca sexta]|uniref:prominin-like protein isoform X2 n=1 Tax=Manduca sexta TaxID=7130 RepID=UPI0018903AEC|nr:prominin-like protein isoform X2 [Manduca sexta]
MVLVVNMWRATWVLALVCVVSGEIGHNMNNITAHLMREMSDVTELAAVNFSQPDINPTYVASMQFDMRAMGPLYNSTHIVIDFIAHKQAYPEGIVTVSDGHPEIASLKDNWRVLVAHYAGPLAVLVVVALLVVVLPLAALFWCCCYWCRVGRRRRPFDRKYDACLKGLLAIVLIALLTLFLFGVVCAFATDSQIDSGAAEAPDSLRAGMKDMRTFLNATQAHARHLLVTNYKELSEKLNSVLYTSGLTVSMKLGEFSRAVSVTTLNKMVQRLDEVQSNLRDVHALTAALRTRAEELNAGLRKVKSQLLQTLARCDQPKCIALQTKYKIGQLDTDIQYSQMPDVSELLTNVTSLIDGHIKEEVAAGQQVFSDIQRGIRRSVDEHIPNVQQSIAETGRRLAAMADRITDMANNASASIEAEEKNIHVVQEATDKYRPYRRYIGIAPAAVLLLITLLMVWGLTCGVCGKRPDVYGASDCCNKGAGSKCLLCGVCVTLVLGAVVCAALGAYFALGLAAQRALCDPLTEPRDNRLFDDVDKFVDLEKVMFNEHSDPDFKLSTVLVSCHGNHTIYETLHLHRLYDLEQLQDEMWGEVSRRVASLRPVFPAAGAHVTILREPAKQKLRQLANTGLSDFDFDKILDALETNMTSLALEGLARQLNSTARSLAQPTFEREARDLLRAAAALSALAAGTLHPMLRDAQRLNATAIKLRDELRFNHSSLKEAISYLMHETTEAEVFLNTQGPERLQNMTKSFATVIASQLQRYMQHVVHEARVSVGRCGPLSNAFNATRDAACHKILMPTNGYWMSLAWCVLLFVPMMVVAQKLAKLYLHVDPYPGPLVEAAYKVEKRSGREGREGRGRGRGEGEVSRGSGAYGGGAGAAGGAPLPAGGGAAARDPALAPALDPHHARRYNDMAPKHWEEGPPRYHGPTEYERPPPYYYPGPNSGNGSAGPPPVIPRAKVIDQEDGHVRRRPKGVPWAKVIAQVNGNKPGSPAEIPRAKVLGQWDKFVAAPVASPRTKVPSPVRSFDQPTMIPWAKENGISAGPSGVPPTAKVLAEAAVTLPVFSNLPRVSGKQLPRTPFNHLATSM